MRFGRLAKAIRAGRAVARPLRPPVLSRCMASAVRCNPLALLASLAPSHVISLRFPPTLHIAPPPSPRPPKHTHTRSQQSSGFGHAAGGKRDNGKVVKVEADIVHYLLPVPWHPPSHSPTAFVANPRLLLVWRELHAYRLCGDRGVSTAASPDRGGPVRTRRPQPGLVRRHEYTRSCRLWQPSTQSPPQHPPLSWPGPLLQTVWPDAPHVDDMNPRCFDIEGTGCAGRQ